MYQMLLIQITKRTGGGAVLRCARSDGSVTWQKQDGKYAAFFALHDLIPSCNQTMTGSTAVRARSV
jgi:hypothetical protein